MRIVTVGAQSRAKPVQVESLSQWLSLACVYPSRPPEERRRLRMRLFVAAISASS
jgi:hypothetical protein